MIPLWNVLKRKYYWNAPWHTETNVYDKEWDLLIILDACRVDALRELQPEYGFLGTIESIYSVGGQSQEWMNATFTEDYASEISNTTYITGNPYSSSLKPSRFKSVHEVWKTEWSEEHGTVLADSITNRVIRYGRSKTANRVIAHYMQPHFPSIPAPLDGDLDLETWGESWDSPLHRLERGEIQRERVWQSYLDNLRYVLNSVQKLVKNYDADRSVITSDHGNGFGEHGIYGHPRHCAFPQVRKVPWVLINSRDEKQTHPKVSEKPREDGVDVEDRLRALGYR